MKQKPHSQLAALTRKAMQLSAVGITGLSLLTSSVAAQDIETAFASGESFSFVRKPTVEDEWVPPSTPVPASPAVEQRPSSDWSAPYTPAEVAIPDSVTELEQPTVVIQSSDISIEQPVPATAIQDSIVLSPQDGMRSLLTEPAPSIPEASRGFVSDVNSAMMQSESLDGLELAPLEQPLEFDSGTAQSVVSEGFDLQSTPESEPVLQGQTENSQLVSTDFETVSSVGVSNVTGPQLRTPVRNILGGVESRLAGNGGVHAVGQLTFLSLSRDYRGKGRILSNGAPNLLANGPDESDFTGVDISYGRRRAGGQGWEMRYFGFNPDQATDVAGSGPTLVWGGITPPLNDPATWGGAIPAGVPETFGLSGIGLGAFSMADLFDDANNHRVSRDSEFGSFEFNFLRASAGGRRLSCGNATVEFFGGLRGVSFKETTTFTARALQSASFPRSAFYSSEVQNSLFGLQIGGRLERQRKNGWSTSFGSRVGIYNNRVESRQRAEYQFADGSTAVPQVRFGDDAGREFDFEGKDNELAFLGELDLGVIYQFRARTRARVGFRGIAVTNIADSAGQLEDNLYDADLVAEPKAWGDLIVGGFYFGVDHAF